MLNSATGMGSPGAGLVACLAATWAAGLEAWRGWHEVWQFGGRLGSKLGRWQQQYLVEPANTQKENLNIQPSEKIGKWKVTPPPPH